MDTYFSSDYTIQRLKKEYEKHKSLIIALDFDDTIYDCHKKGHEFKNVIKLIQDCNALGFYVIIFTASKPSRFPMMLEYCERIDIKVQGINKNKEGLPHEIGTAGKIYYNILLDDRAGLYSAYKALRQVVDEIMINEIK